jgi:hypothetical protein
MHLRFSIRRPLGLALTALVATLLVAASGERAEAARISKSQGSKVLIDLEGTSASPGGQFYVVNNGRRVGVVKISRVQGGRATGDVMKGSAPAGASVESAGGGGNARNSGRGGRSQARSSRPTYRPPVANATYIGVMAGYGMDSQTVKTVDAAGNTGSVSMSGSGYSLKGFMDMPFSGSLGLIGRGGIEQLNLTGGSDTTSIMYLTADALLRYSFGSGTFIPFGALGLGIHFPLSKSSTVLDVPRISSTTVFFFTGGFNYQWNRDMIVTVIAEYGMFPPSNDVSTTLIAIRGGAGWRF